MTSFKILLEYHTFIAKIHFTLDGFFFNPRENTIQLILTML